MKKLEQEERVRRIADFVRSQTSEQDVRVEDLRPLAGGSSRQVWNLDLTLGSKPDPMQLVLRIDPLAGKTTGLGGSNGFIREFRLLQEAVRCDVLVPRVYWACEDNETLGGPFYLMDRIEGEAIARRIFRAPELEKARAALPTQLGTALARIHRMDLNADGLDDLPAPAPGKSSPEEQIVQLRTGIDAAPAPTPVCELAFRFLERNVPDEGDRTIVHGDFRVGNVMVGPDGLRAVLDWELAHIGDPHEDLAWMCTKTWRFGNIDKPVGGIGAREPFYSAYEAESGRKLDRDALRYWEIICSLKVAVVWIFQVSAYLSGMRPSVEQAAIGRRMAETELDLLQLLDVA
ncbi:MAG: phosphotransferase family protein [bacterium]|nr:phosphotransferase family protein [bacterium]